MARPSASRELPPKLELDCLKVLWSIRQGNVKQVQDGLAPGRLLAYTTVMTVLDRLSRRGCVVRRKSGRSFVYAPVLTQDCVRRLAIQELADSLFDGSVSNLSAYLNQRDSALAMAAAVDGGSDARLDTSLL